MRIALERRLRRLGRILAIERVLPS